jgi:hypothetical protein
MARSKGFFISMIVPTAHLASVLDHVADMGVGDLQVMPVARPNGAGGSNAGARSSLKQRVLESFNPKKAMRVLDVATALNLKRGAVQTVTSALERQKLLKRTGRGLYIQAPGAAFTKQAAGSGKE